MYEKNNMKPILTEEEFDKLAQVGELDKTRVIKPDGSVNQDTDGQDSTT